MYENKMMNNGSFFFSYFDAILLEELCPDSQLAFPDYSQAVDEKLVFILLIKRAVIDLYYEHYGIRLERFETYAYEGYTPKTDILEGLKKIASLPIKFRADMKKFEYFFIFKRIVRAYGASYFTNRLDQISDSKCYCLRIFVNYVINRKKIQK